MGMATGNYDNCGQTKLEPKQENKNKLIESSLSSVFKVLGYLDDTLMEIETGNDKDKLSTQVAPDHQIRSISDLLTQLPKDLVGVKERINHINHRLRELVL